tara:strand:+ start:54 stop:446 length:393 start_codon:yes stop_codon:yes gene_type:complete
MTYLNLNAGDEVGIARRSHGSLMGAKFGIVVKINAYGHIYVDVGELVPLRFDKDGNAYKVSYGAGLVNAVALRDEIAFQEKRKAQARIVREMEQALKEGWSYQGTWYATQQRVDTLKNLVAEMEKMVDTA